MKTLLIDLTRSSEPTWSSQVERWYQLDEISFAYCEAISQWNFLQDLPRPQVVILATEGASNLADFDFAHADAISPAKFVYTLPNIFAAVMFQLLGWSGKTYCLHQGSSTLEFALHEAAELAKSGQSVWLFHSSPQLEQGRRRVSFLLP